jgi:hypothetical protein
VLTIDEVLPKLLKCLPEDVVPLRTTPGLLKKDGLVLLGRNETRVPETPGVARQSAVPDTRR